MPMLSRGGMNPAIDDANNNVSFKHIIIVINDLILLLKLSKATNLV